jgi:hypothetical protein
MTVPEEKFYAIEKTRRFLFDLLNPKKTPRVPRDVRRMAANCLRHYPYTYDMEEAQKLAPKVFGKRENK